MRGQTHRSISPGIALGALQHVVEKKLKPWVTDNRLIARTTHFYITTRDELLKRYYSHRYDAPVDPRELLWIDPSVIEYKRTTLAKQKTKFGLPVQDGGWDQHRIPLDEYDLCASIYEHFESGIPWDETSFYHRVKENAQDDEWSKWGCDDFQDFLDRLQYLEEIYDAIRSEGYKRYTELTDRSDRGLDPLPPEYYEITVLIGRNGELLLGDGRHRLALAHTADVDSVPVRVKVRHAEWQGYRDSVYRGDREPMDHPDVRSSSRRH